MAIPNVTINRSGLNNNGRRKVDGLLFTGLSAIAGWLILFLPGPVTEKSDEEFAIFFMSLSLNSIFI